MEYTSKTSSCVDLVPKTRSKSSNCLVPVWNWSVLRIGTISMQNGLDQYADWDGSVCRMCWISMGWISMQNGMLRGWEGGRGMDGDWVGSVCRMGGIGVKGEGEGEKNGEVKMESKR